MSEPQLPAALDGACVFMVGIKGTGMAALCELLVRRGARVCGSDSSEVFYTDAILSRLGVTVFEDFAADRLPDDVDLVVHSAAYDPETHPQLCAARERGLPVLVYTQALGALSRGRPAVAVAGVHGKTTTTALVGALVRTLGLPGEVLVGSAVSVFDGFSTYFGGTDFFVAETCEYRRNFLAFQPDILVVTSIEADHLDYFKNEDDVHSAFLEFARKLPEGGTLIYCADDPGATRLAGAVHTERRDLRRVAYGRSAAGPYAVTGLTAAAGRTAFRLAGVGTELALRVPGAHNVLNAAAAVAATAAVAETLDAAVGGGADAPHGDEAHAESRAADGHRPSASIQGSSQAIAEALWSFTGTRRRSELVGERGGVIYMDDYAHHPTAIAATLAGIRKFYPGRRVVVSFMSHTYSRTAGMLEEFARAFGDADVVVTHKIYASAREHFDGRIEGRDLADAIGRHHSDVRYVPEVMDAFDGLRRELRPGDVFISMGAGNNWILSHRLFEAAAGQGAAATGQGATAPGQRGHAPGQRARAPGQGLPGGGEGRSTP
ncbi:MAG: UDP-N-acetylmuramate--L-alanine ligase [Spirochaetaceae bacterium]